MRTLRRSDFLCVVALAASLALRATDASPVANSAQIESGTEVDASGRVIRAPDGRRSNYARGVVTRSNVAPRRTAQVSVVTGAGTGTAGAAKLAGSSHAAFASFASLGSCLGCTGLPLHRDGNRLEAFASTAAVSFLGRDDTYFPNDFWYALSFDSRTASFNQVYVSERQPGGISQMLLLPPQQGAGSRVAICGFDGSIRFYAANSKAFLPDQTLQFPVSDVSSCAIGDFDHSGQAQYLLVTRSAITIFDHGGVALWTLPPPDYFYQGITVGQMDDDPALEIAVSQYTDPWSPGGPPVTIYDGATHAVQQQINSDALPAAYQLMVANLVKGSAPSLLVSEGWYAVDAFDPVAGARLWQAPTPINIGALAVASQRRGTSQVIIGDRQWGAVHVIDGASGAPLYSINNPEYGVDQLAVGKFSDGGSEQIMWTSGAGGTGAKRFIIADAASRQVIAKSLDLDPVFTTPAIGHLGANASRQVVFASQTTDDKYGVGAIVALDARSGKVVATQNDSRSQGFGTYDALRVADLDGDGVDEVIVAASHYYSGSLDVYEMTSDRSFIQLSTTSTTDAAGLYPEFTAFALGKAGGGNSIYGVVGFNQYNPVSGAMEGTIVGLRPVSGEELWRVALPGDAAYPGVYSPSPSAIEPMGRDALGRELFAVLRPAPNYPIDFLQVEQVDVIRVGHAGASVVSSYSGPFISMDVTGTSPTTQRILLGTSDGAVCTLAFNGSALSRVSSRTVATTPIDAVRAGRGSDLWIVSGQRAGHVNAGGTLNWQSTDNGYSWPVGLLIDSALDKGVRMWVSSVWRVDGFNVADRLLPQ